MHDLHIHKPLLSQEEHRNADENKQGHCPQTNTLLSLYMSILQKETQKLNFFSS